MDTIQVCNQLDDEILAHDAMVAQCERLLRAVRYLEAWQASTGEACASLARDLVLEGVHLTQQKGDSLTQLAYSLFHGRPGRNHRARYDVLRQLLKWELGVQRQEILRRELVDLQHEIFVIDRTAIGTDLTHRRDDLFGLQSQPVIKLLNEQSTILIRARGRSDILQAGIAAGESLLCGMQKLTDALKSAVGWGAGELHQMGMAQTSSYRQDSLDEVFEGLLRILPAICRFLMLLREEFPEVETLALFPDLCVDYLLADLAAGNPMSDTLEAVQAVSGRLRVLLSKATHSLEQAKRTMQALEGERQAILRQVG